MLLNECLAKTCTPIRLLWIPQSRDRSASTLMLLKETTTFGRDLKCDFRLDWDGCSRTHFTIRGERPNGSGLPTEWLLVDAGNGTNNGVFVNSRRISRDSRLKDGDVIGIGRGRDVAEGGLISDRNLEYVFQLQCMAASKDPSNAQVRKGKLEHQLVDKGMHRHLRGAARHPLGGHAVAGDQRDAREKRAEMPAGETFAPCRAVVYCPSNYRPSAADNRLPPSHLQARPTPSCLFKPTCLITASSSPCVSYVLK